MASIAVAIVFAVYMPPQAPGPGLTEISVNQQQSKGGRLPGVANDLLALLFGDSVVHFLTVGLEGGDDIQLDWRM